MTTKEVLKQLEALGNEGTARLLMKHGAKQPCWGVKVEDMKKLLKPLKGRQDVALELFASGVFDAMYMAGLLADGAKMTRAELDAWAQSDYGSSISSYTVPWVASESPFGFELAVEWINSKKEFVAVSGWSALGCIVTITPDEKLDISQLKKLLIRVSKELHHAPNKVRSAMNSFIIAVGSYVLPLTKDAIGTANKLGVVTVDMNGTACKVPAAADYIAKVADKGNLGKKRKTVKC
jgi:3-methyladenine DNA glycosylase AlkD